MAKLNKVFIKRGVTIKNGLLITIIALVVIGLLYFRVELSNKPELSSISGSVSPAKGGTVMLVQNNQVVAQTEISPSGEYIINGLTEGNYNLMFIVEDKGYIYDDYQWSNSIRDSIKISKGKKLYDINFELDERKADFRAGKVAVWFYDNITQMEIEDLIRSTGSTIDIIGPVTILNSYQAKITIPENSSELQLIEIFSRMPQVKQARLVGIVHTN